MWEKILLWLRKIVDKRICTVEDFTQACDIAKTKLLEDKDGFVSIGECGRLIVTILINMRVK